MGDHSFMLSDLLRSLAAVSIAPLFLFVPGFVLGWLANLFDFRRRSAAFRIALSVPLSISVCPIVVYLAGRYASMLSVWLVFATLWACFLAIAVPRLRGMVSLTRADRPFALAALIWTVLAIGSLIDLQSGHKVYFSTVVFDYSLRSEFIHSISATGIPPATPFFYPGHPVPIRYHYFWLLIGSLVEQAGGQWIGPRAAWIGTAVWCGIGLLCLVALYFRLFRYRTPEDFRRRALIAIALLSVTGLDIIPVAILWILRFTGIRSAILPSLEWWNEQVDGFVYTALWEAHYLAGLIACLTAFLLLWEAPRQSSNARRLTYAAVAALGFASAAGAAIYISMVFAAFLSLWALITVWKRWWTETALLAAAGIVAALLFLPYAASLRGAGNGGPLLKLWIRPFLPVNALAQGVGVSGAPLYFLNALMLPINYFFELGVFLAAALLWWKQRPKPLPREDLAIAAMIAVSVLICTFLRSSVIGNNDLGWRGFLIAQFGLLLWSAEVFSDTGRARGAYLTALLVLGLLGSAYDVVILRAFPIMADAGVVVPIGWMAPDRQLGTRTYAAREAYDWAAHHLPPSARLQFNPHVYVQDTQAFLYANRQMVVTDEGCLTGFGGNPAECPGMLEELEPYFPKPGRPAAPSLAGLCRSLPAGLIVARDLDAAWANRQSWVWKETPLFANSYYRLFGCR
jgi:hypothetical protein